MHVMQHEYGGDRRRFCAHLSSIYHVQSFKNIQQVLTRAHSIPLALGVVTVTLDVYPMQAFYSGTG